MSYGDEPRERLNKLEKKLYSRNLPDATDAERSSLGDRPDTGVDEGWKDLKQNNFDNIVSKFSKTAEGKHNAVKKIFYASLVFFVVALMAAIFVFLGGMNMVSSRNVDIRVSGPLSVAAGQQISLDLNVVNSNNVDLNSVTLLLEYPSGTRSPSNLSQEIDREKFDLDTIKSGESKNRSVSLVFFGEKESVKQIKMSLEYRVENSSALFYKDKNYDVTISSSPVIITPIYPKEVNSNQDMSFVVEVASNSKDKIDDFLVSIEYPFGFVFGNANPTPTYGNNIWRLSNLMPGDKKRISILGSISGQDNEERTFRLTAGTPNSDDERDIGVLFAELSESVVVKKPFLGVDFKVGGGSNDYIARGGSQVGSEISIKNNLPSRIFNTTVEVAIKGGAFDRLSVAANNGGFFQSFNDSLFWDKRSVQKLADMAPGESVNLGFQLTPLTYFKIPEGSKPEVEMEATIKGERVLDSGKVEQITIIEKRKVTLATDLVLASRTVRSIGNIENSGPVPPRVNQATTYTIHWRIDNSFNQVSNAEVRATLPPYVRFTGIKYPASEQVSYNENTKEVVWDAGVILPFTGINTPAKEVYFQLEFLPSTSQINQSPMILGNPNLTGIDKLSGQKINSSASLHSINFSTDPNFRSGDDKVSQ